MKILTMSEINALLTAAGKVVEAVAFDDSGINGRGGNGGLLSRETIGAADELRRAIGRVRDKLAGNTPPGVASSGSGINPNRRD